MSVIKSLNVPMVAGFIGVCLFMAAILAGRYTLADSNSVVEWASGDPLTVTNRTVYDTSSTKPVVDKCEYAFNGYGIKMYEAGWGMTLKPACTISMNDKFNLVSDGTYALISFKGESTYHNIRYLGCASEALHARETCIYIPETDMLINRIAVWPKTGADTLVVYNNFTERLSVVIPPSNPSAAYYEFNSSNPDFVFNDSQGNNIPVKSIRTSNNNRWLLIEMHNYGYIRMNLDDMTMRKVLDTSSSSTAQFIGAVDISNDGNHVVDMSANSPMFKVYDIDDTCGRTIVNNGVRTDTSDALLNVCPSLSYNGTAPMIIDGFNKGSYPKFVADDGGEIRFFAEPAMSSPKPSHWVTIKAPNYTASPRLDYLAMGDSYSSGEGDTYVDPHTNRKRYRDYTDVEESYANDQPREKCHVSTMSYPYKIANSFQLSLANATNAEGRWQTVACSGAQTYDVTEADSTAYEGQGKGSSKQLITDGSIPRLKGYSNKEQLKVDALNEFIPGRQKQIEFVKKYKPKVITLTMGGNDVGFGGRLGTCLFKGFTCTAATEAGRRDLSADVKRQFSKLTALYHDLKQASPGVKIYVLSYPQAIVDTENASCGANVNGLNDDERKVIVAGYWYMNQVIKTAANAQGVQYVDVEDALVGHRLCEGGTAYANGLAMWGHSELQETFHPNAEGNTFIANKFYEKLNYEDPRTYSQYASNANPDLTVNDIPNSVYLQTATPPTSNKETKAMTFPEQVKSTIMNVLSNSYTLAKSTLVTITLHSDPVTLGTATTGIDGSLNANVTIPSSVPAGYHTLIVSGKTYSGESIEYEQTILVTGSNSGDLDDNGVPDVQQLCGPFITPANEDIDYDGIDDACDPEITDPILYIARNGDSNKGEDVAKLYVYRNTRASSVTGITNDYVNISLDPNSREALVAESLSINTQAVFNKFLMLEDDLSTATPKPMIPTILAKDSTNQCIALQPIDYLSPALDPLDVNYTLRGFTKLTALPIGVNCGD